MYKKIFNLIQVCLSNYLHLPVFRMAPRSDADINAEPRRKVYFGIIFVATIIMAGGYCWLGYATTPFKGERILNSPDEMANFYFTKVFAESGRLSTGNPLVGDWAVGEKHQQPAVENPLPVGLGPRAITVAGNKLAPGSFLGMIIIYGAIAKVFGSGIIIYLTSIFSIFGVLFFYKLIKEIFSPKVAFISSLLLLVLPPFWYYNARSMFHNVLFLDLIIIGFYWLVIYFKKATMTRAIWASLFFGLALFVRMSETLWLLPIIATALIINRKKIKPPHLAVVLLFYCFIILLFFIGQKSVQGSFLAAGYGAKLKNFGSYLLPFGFHPWRALINLYKYFVQFFWWLVIPFFVVLIIQLGRWKKSTKPQQLFLCFYVFMVLWLTVYYGSWYFKDTLSPAEITIGTSYTRYWLPIYVFGLPMAALALIKLVDLFKVKLVKGALVIILAAAFLLLSAQLTVTGTEESLFQVQTRISEYYLVREKVERLVPADAVIVTARHDKVFFPKFGVVAGLTELSQFKELARIALVRPIYYYTFLNDADLAGESEKFQEYGLALREGVEVFGRERLYRVILSSRATTTPAAAGEEESRDPIAKHYGVHH